MGLKALDEEGEKRRAQNHARYEARKTKLGTGYDVENYRRGQLSPRTRAYRLWNGARSRGKHPVTITVDWVEERLRAGVCEVSGVPFVLGERRSAFAPSLDRTDNALGYTPENTRVVAWSYNMAKGTFTHNDMLRLAEGLCIHAKK